MNDIITHRGPDDEGFIFFKRDSLSPSIFGGKTTPKEIFESNTSYCPKQILADNYPENAVIALGQRRLSILDLSPKGHQPLSSEDGKLWCVYNGEIYNYLEIRKELEERGHKFHSNTDTEVILAAYSEWGKDCLNHFNGMWAFIIVDTAKKKVFIARDRFGIKPLYFWFSPEKFLALSSEIKQFTVLPGWKARVNPQRAYDFLQWELLEHTNETMFADVFQLRRGEALEFNLDDLATIIEKKSLPIYQWYYLKAKPFSGSLAKAAKEFETLFVDSVKLRLRADVPVGSCLSGGMDSSSIVCVANRLLTEQSSESLQKTFSVCSHEKQSDEREYIDEVIKTTMTDAYYVYPSLDDLFANLDEIVWIQDEPFCSTSIYAQWSVFKLAAKNNVKVMLDGQGADEHLAGYHGFFPAFFTGLFKSFNWRTLYNEIKSNKKLYGYSEAKSGKMLLGNLLPEKIKVELKHILSANPQSETSWLNLSRLGAEYINPFYQNNPKPENIFDLSYAQLTATNLQMLLHWEDRDSMIHSVESRLPFLDFRLVEFVLGLPEEFKISQGITKVVLREGLKDFLPEKIKNRVTKLGFATPEAVWIKQNADKFRFLIKKAIEKSNGILKTEALNEFEDIVEGKKEFSFLPWRLISFGEWIEKFDVLV